MMAAAPVIRNADAAPAVTARAIITVHTDPGLTGIENGASVGSAALDEISASNFDLVEVPLLAPPPPTTTQTPTPTDSATSTSTTPPTATTTAGTSPTTTTTTTSGGNGAAPNSGAPASPGGGSLAVTGVALAAITGIGVSLVLVGRTLRSAGRGRPTDRGSRRTAPREP